MQFMENESDDTTITAQAISFTTPPTSLIFRLQQGAIGNQFPYEVRELGNQDSLGLR